MPIMEKLGQGAAKLGLELTPEQLKQFQIYYQELLDWNQRMNLTAITDYAGVQIKHFLDSLTVTLAWPRATAGFHVIDVGTGAGFPGIPLKILWPDIKMVLLDSTAKKAAFLDHIRGKLALRDLEIVVGRAEEVARDARYREQFAMVLSRAVAALPVLVELALPFCAIGGRFIAQKKGAIDTEINAAAGAISKLGGRLNGIKRIDLEELSDDRWLVIIDKLLPTPQQYPRRPGIPGKRPLK